MLRKWEKFKIFVEIGGNAICMIGLGGWTPLHMHITPTKTSTSVYAVCKIRQLNGRTVGPISKGLVLAMAENLFESPNLLAN